MLSDRTPGTTWTVQRMLDLHGRGNRYALIAERGEHRYVFLRGVTVQEMKLVIASLCDMIQMGFIPVIK